MADSPSPTSSSSFSTSSSFPSPSITHIRHYRNEMMLPKARARSDFTIAAQEPLLEHRFSHQREYSVEQPYGNSLTQSPPPRTKQSQQGDEGTNYNQQQPPQARAQYNAVPASEHYHRSNDHNDNEEKQSQQYRNKKSTNNNGDQSDSHRQKSSTKQSHTVKRTSPSDYFKGKYAVDVNSLTHSYVKKADAKPTLSDVRLQIEVGKIYGLLGPSGCGKTTLIKCLLAQLEPSEGTILCFGEKPGSELSQVPGHDVGYMPQEIALYDEFSVWGNLSFYAKLHGMSKKEFNDRANYLCKLLDLKHPKKKTVKQLSGGQQRRTSLACGLLHSPKLLILDEPTVGVDPTLRAKIWHYLIKISSEEGTSVLLTTHYIEEARKAHTVGLMRAGRMLEQGSPDEIMKKTKSKTLEAAFLKICKADEKKENEEKKNANEDDSSDSDGSDISDDFADSDLEELSDTGGDFSPDAKDPSARDESQHQRSPNDTTAKGESTFSKLSSKDYKASGTKSSPCETVTSPSSRNARHLQSPTDEENPPSWPQKGSQTKGGDSSKGCGAPPLKGWSKISYSLALPRAQPLCGLIWKNFQRMIHGVAAMIFQFIMPSIQVILFCIAIGKDPQHIHMGLVNQDMGLSNTQWNQYNGVGLTGVNLPYIPTISPLQPTDDPLSPTFLSDSFRKHLDDHFIIDEFHDESSARSAVDTNQVWGFIHIPTNFTLNTLIRINETIFDPTRITNETLLNSTISYTLDMSNEQMTIFLVKSIMSSYSDLLQEYAPGYDKNSPLQMKEPVYGDADASFTDFIAPGIIITIAFSGSIGLTAITFVLDKKTGNMDRMWSCGVWASEIMLAQVLTQLLVFVIQVGLLLLFGLVVFKLPLHGSLVLLFCICILLGITGMMFGLVIASKVSEERDAMQCALGSFFPALLLSGVMWPIEAIPIPLYYLSLSLPTTWAAEAGRSIMSRGWGLEHRQVWLGLVVPFAWSFVFFIWAARSLRAKK